MNVLSDKITYRRASPHDAHDLIRFYIEIYGGGYTKAPFDNEGNLASYMKEGKLSIHVAEDRTKLVGSTASELNRRRKRVEFGRTAVHKNYRGESIAKNLSMLAAKDARKEDFILCWGTCRNTPILKVAVDTLGMTPIGYTSRYTPGGNRETHILVLGSLNKPPARARRLDVPNRLYDYNIIRRIQDDFNAAEHIHGDTGTAVTTDEGHYDRSGEVRLSYQYHERDDSGDICGFSGFFPGYTEAIVLADRKEFIANLAKLDFKPTAFRPAWHISEKRGHAFDCLTMAKSDFYPSSTDKAIDKKIGFFKEGFDEINLNLEYL